MDILVDRPSQTIQVRDASGYAVCTKCKGSGDAMQALYYDPYAWGGHGLLWLGVQRSCPQCYGAGYWRALPQLPPSSEEK